MDSSADPSSYVRVVLKKITTLLKHSVKYSRANDLLGRVGKDESCVNSPCSGKCSCLAGGNCFQEREDGWKYDL